MHVSLTFSDIANIRYWGCRFWGRGYFSTTNGAITEDIVLQYVENHIADPTGASR
ncbi:transposase [Roseobacter sp. SK209-2-6]|uniref:transposase n=1 Tax=Roseobacter sp. SK209-2-6 TaxID=388739 RepID=UPI0003140D5C|nr:transposase [Roseobacter sp. SK209-2-6]